MIFRNLARRPVRAALAMLGIALAASILVVGRFFIDAVQTIADVQFRAVQRDDVTLAFTDPRSARAAFAVARLPGVIEAESFRAVPARLRFAHRSRRVALLGLPAEAELRRPIGRDMRPVAVSPAGVVLTAHLAKILGVSTGDRLTVEVLEGDRPVREVAVAGLVDELIGLSAYMEIGALNRLMREGDVVSGAMLRVDPLAEEGLYARLKRMPAVSGVSMRTAALRSFEDTLARSLGIFTTVLVSFACVIALAMVYNTARIALSERGRELASLRILGFTRGEVSFMLFGEQILLTVAAIPLGCALGTGMCALLARAYQWELFRIPLVVSRQTYAFAAMVVLAAALFSGLLVRRRMDRFDLVAVLKTRE